MIELIYQNVYAVSPARIRSIQARARAEGFAAIWITLDLNGVDGPMACTGTMVNRRPPGILPPLGYSHGKGRPTLSPAATGLSCFSDAVLFGTEVHATDVLETMTRLVNPASGFDVWLQALKCLRGAAGDNAGRSANNWLRHWMATPHRALGGLKPEAIADDPGGEAQLMRLIVFDLTDPIRK